MDSFIEALIADKRSKQIPLEYDYFGQLVGEWDFINVFDYGKKEVHGEWIFSWVLQGTAIQDTFISPSRKERLKTPLQDGEYSEYGTSVRIFNQLTKAWDVVYGNAGHMVRLEAKREADKIVLTEISTREMKWIFSEISENYFHWQHTTMNGNGEWVVNGELYATRRK